MSILLLLFLNFIICSSNLIEQVKKEIINKALLNLPKRQDIDILKLGKSMSKLKEEYLMTDAEAAYLAYEWIIQNIELDCSSNNNGIISSLVATTYKEGKGGAVGISGIFNILGSLLNIENDIILGVTKIATLNYTQIIQFKDHAWNYILIDNKYYLLDVSMGAGFCVGKDFHEKRTDFYFGTEPDLFIRSHYPNDDKWQLLSKVFKKDEFKSMAFLYDDFYTLGFKSISPDIQTIRNKNKIKIQLISDNSFDEIFDDLIFLEERSSEGEWPYFGFIDVNKISNGVYEFDYSLYDSGYYDIYVENQKTRKIYFLLTLEVYNDNYMN